MGLLQSPKVLLLDQMGKNSNKMWGNHKFRNTPTAKFPRGRMNKSPIGGFLKWWYPQSSSISFHGIFPELNHPSLGNPPRLWKPPNSLHMSGGLRCSERLGKPGPFCSSEVHPRHQQIPADHQDGPATQAMSPTTSTTSNIAPMTPRDQLHPAEIRTSLPQLDDQ